MISLRIFLIVITVLLSATASLAQCPTITVIGPTGITNPGDEMTFRVEVGVVGPRLEYLWTVSAGTIVEGQGNPVIRVATDRTLEGANITAAVDVGGLPIACEKTGSEVAPVAPVAGCGGPVDEWGKLKPNEVRVRLDAAFAELSNNPTNIGVFVIEITHKERLDSHNQRVQFILRHARFRKFDTGRIWFVLELGEEPRTKFYRIPPGGDFPCSECLIIKGGDVQ